MLARLSNSDTSYVTQTATWDLRTNRLNTKGVPLPRSINFIYHNHNHNRLNQQLLFSYLVIVCYPIPTIYLSSKGR
jgi:hypothetical protein